MAVGLVVALAALFGTASQAAALEHGPDHGHPHQHARAAHAHGQHGAHGKQAHLKPAHQKPARQTPAHQKPAHQTPGRAAGLEPAAAVPTGAGRAHAPADPPGHAKSNAAHDHSAKHGRHTAPGHMPSAHAHEQHGAHGKKAHQKPGRAAGLEPAAAVPIGAGRAHGPDAPPGHAKTKAAHEHSTTHGRHLARGHARSGTGHQPPGRAGGHRLWQANELEQPVRTAAHTVTGGVRAPLHRTTAGRHRAPSHPSPGGRSGSSRTGTSAIPPIAGSGSVVAPLRRLGKEISDVSGLSVFAGPLGWVLTGLLLLAVLMVGAALLLGRRSARTAGRSVVRAGRA